MVTARQTNMSRSGSINGGGSAAKTAVALMPTATWAMRWMHSAKALNENVFKLPMNSACSAQPQPMQFPIWRGR